MRIFLTGITGTIGRAFVDLLKDDYHILGVDRNENGVAKFKKDYPDIDIKVGDFGDVDFVRDGVDVLIHLAAMKHIDLCEQNANECVTNNVIKTHWLFSTAYHNHVKILFMSTDKAVEPASTYGYTKALGEAMALEYEGSIVRSGNVVASNGSVLEVWDNAIEKHETIKVTHKDMKRYFITPENLVSQVWGMFTIGEKTIIPKMDRHVRLMELLKEKLAVYNFTIEDYPGGIEYTGLRPGEKLDERLTWKK